MVDRSLATMNMRGPGKKDMVNGLRAAMNIAASDDMRMRIGPGTVRALTAEAAMMRSVLTTDTTVTITMNGPIQIRIR